LLAGLNGYVGAYTRRQSTGAKLRLRFFFPYTSSIGTTTRRDVREEQTRINVKFASTLVIAAAIIVAIRLARKDIAQPTPRLLTSVGQGVTLDRMILN
jgi:hypothetical protein